MAIALSRLAAAIAGAALVGCSDSTSPPPSLTGQWQSDWAGSIVTVGLTEEASGAITGTGNFVNGQLTGVIAVTGNHTHPDVNLNFTITGYQPANFIGRFDPPWTIRGVLNGSGFVNDSIQFGKL